MNISARRKDREQYIGKIQELLYELKIESVMSRDLIIISPEFSVKEARDILMEKKVSGVPVMEEGKVAGLFTIKELFQSLDCSELDIPVREKMRPPPPSSYADESVAHALHQLTKFKERRVLVFNHQEELVGVITSGDISAGLLKAINLSFRQEEVSQYRARHIFQDIESDETSLVLRYNVLADDFTHGGEASSKIKRAMQRLGANPQYVRRCAIAIYEAEINLIIHTSRGGNITVEFTPNKITMTVVDDGPGIPDIEQAMQEGYSTSTMAVKSLGFGAGMGLPNIKRCVDEMSLESVVGDGPGKGTTLTMILNLRS